MNTPPKTAYDFERRRYPRLRTQIPVELKCSGKAAIRTATDEISLCSCYIEMVFTMDVGTKLELVFSLNQERVAAKGIVVTQYPQVGNGIDFIEMAPDDRLKLTDYMTDCEAQTELTTTS